MYETATLDSEARAETGRRAAEHRRLTSLTEQLAQSCDPMTAHAWRHFARALGSDTDRLAGWERRRLVAFLEQRDGQGKLREWRKRLDGLA